MTASSNAFEALLAAPRGGPVALLHSGGDGGVEVVHLRERRLLRKGPHLDRAGARHLTQVVAEQVDDHRQLGLVLLAVEQLLQQRRV